MILISHFLNEELLLPYWLKHHLPLFDHGVLVDYGSTDASVDIIRQLAPSWEIRRTKVQFKEPLIGNEIQEIEEEFSGWKIVLNTTEFLLCDNLRDFIREFEWDFPMLPGFRTSGMIMVDTVEEQHRPLTSESLLSQRRWGFLESPQRHFPVYRLSGYTPLRCRFFHKLPRGHYLNGRHNTMVQTMLKPISEKFGLDLKAIPQERSGWVYNSWWGIHPYITTCWFGRYCPFEAIKERVLIADQQIGRNLFAGSLEEELGVVRKFPLVSVEGRG